MLQVIVEIASEQRVEWRRTRFLSGVLEWNHNFWLVRGFSPKKGSRNTICVS
jgi:hypothetical protein